jgi:hypothetical protein
MSARVIWVGLDQFKAELRRLPDTLTADGDLICRRTAFAAAASVRLGYDAHTYSGNLAEHVAVIDMARARFGTAYRVRAGARHAHMFEFGTQARHTSLGWDRGAAPPGNVFVPRMQRYRLAMYAELAAMMRSHGLTVTTVTRLVA